jgi:4'-phosphopantetheinyl transferase
MIDVYWLEQTQEDAPAEEDWLSVNEAACLDTMRFAKRRADWRLGRWTAKRAAAIYLGLTGEIYGMIEVQPAASGAPKIFLPNGCIPLSISLSHSNGRAVCAMAPAGTLLGCDLEKVEPRGETFLADYFTIREQAMVHRAPQASRDLLTTLLWSTKESALKALHTGLRLDTRTVEATPACPSADLLAAGRWAPISVCYRDSERLEGWWQHEKQLVRTLIAVPAPGPPILLQYVPVFATTNS